MNLQRIEELRLPPKVETEIADLLSRCMTHDYEGRSFFQNRFHCRFIVRDDDLLVGHLALDFRAVRLADQLFNVVGIGDVVVDQNYRRRGFGRALVDEALKEGRLAHAQFALLFGDKSIYSQAGFSPAPNHIVSTSMRGAKTAETVTAPHQYFKVCALGSTAWDDDALVDLAGYPF